jgi:hypothetical protein
MFLNATMFRVRRQAIELKRKNENWAVQTISEAGWILQEKSFAELFGALTT